jgi:hypothetical protein
LNGAKRDRDEEERTGIDRNARIETEIDQILAGEEDFIFRIMPGT